MACRLEDLKPGVAVHGLVADGSATVVAVEWHGRSCVTLTYRTPGGDVAHQLLYRSGEASLDLEQKGSGIIDRQGSVAELRAAIPRAIRKLQEGAISTIDLGQATIGPGMAIFSRFARVIEPTGEAMTVRSALVLIGQVQGEVLDEFVGDLDGWTRWAMTWYRDHGFDQGSLGDAENLFKTTNTSLDGLVRAGIVRSRAGKVALLSYAELPDEWAPEEDSRVTVWEVTQHLVKRLTSAGGEEAAAALLRRTRRWADEARSLAYWLSLAAVPSRPKEALDYDALVTSWPELARLAEREPQEEPGTLLL